MTQITIPEFICPHCEKPRPVYEIVHIREADQPDFNICARCIKELLLWAIEQKKKSS